jgi:hypothetical protein
LQNLEQGRPDDRGDPVGGWCAIVAGHPTDDIEVVSQANVGRCLMLSDPSSHFPVLLPGSAGVSTGVIGAEGGVED